MGNFSRTSDNHAVPDIVHLASWLNVDDVWLRHVIEFDFGCGCSCDPEIEGPHCAIWKAIQKKLEAEENLARAEKEYAIAINKQKGISL
jgi:hypothetical protein